MSTKDQTVLQIKKPLSIKNEKSITEKLFLDYAVLKGHPLKFTSPGMYENIGELDYAKNTVIELTKSIISLRRAITFLTRLRSKGGTVLFVGTRYDLRFIVERLAQKSKSPYIIERWLKGLLTNWENTSSSIKFYNLFIKKLDLRVKQRKKMSALFQGLQGLQSLPDAIFLVDIITDKEALREARRLNIPVIAFTDTDINIDKIDYPILCNVGSMLSITFLANIIATSFE